jgi:hypothetical protein
MSRLRTVTSRSTEIVVGALILTATTSYLVGDALIASAVDQERLSNPNEAQLVTGALLEFVNAAAVVGIGVLLFPILRRYREGMALAYAGTGIIESALLLVSALFVLLLLPLNEAADAAQLQATGTLAQRLVPLTITRQLDHRAGSCEHRTTAARASPLASRVRASVAGATTATATSTAVARAVRSRASRPRARSGSGRGSAVIPGRGRSDSRC